jgi:hypothetical protein
MGAPAQSPFRNAQLTGHQFVVRDFVVPVVDVVINDHFAFIVSKKLQTLNQAIVFRTVNIYLKRKRRRDVGSDLTSPDCFHYHEPRDAVKISCRIADVFGANFRQARHHAADRYISEIFSVAEAFGNEDANKTGADEFILPSGFVTIGI